MIEKTLERLEQRIRSSQRTSDDAKRDLLGLVNELRGELSGMAEQNEDDARVLADSAAAGSEPAALEAVRDLETAHPRVVGLIRSFLQTLADAGI